MSEPMDLERRLEAAKQTLEAVGQEHVLAFYDRLGPSSRHALLEEIESVDWPEVQRLVETHVRSKPEFALPSDLEPAPWYPCEPDDSLGAKYRDAAARGEAMIRQGKVAAFTVAGGQGTRLGWHGPKGTFPATPVTELPLFGVFAHYLRRVRERYGASTPWYIMTSPLNDGETRSFLAEHDYFGFPAEDVMIFPQQMMPALGPADGKVLLAAPDSIALSPNGHGGSLKALHQSGALADMERRGIEQISYIQIDNPLVHVVDPLFLGLHAMDDAEMSSKMLPKAHPKEKLGNFCLAGGRMAVIEYSDLPDELAERRNDDGELTFRAGSIAIHAIRVDFVKRLNESSGGFGLPYHRADKKVAHLDLDSGQTIEPREPNAVKLETFVFDALPLCEHSIVYETERGEEFAPIKNADGPGVVDSPYTAKQLQMERAARWLTRHGVRTPRGPDGRLAATIEIDPATAIDVDDLARIELPRAIPVGARWKI